MNDMADVSQVSVYVLFVLNEELTGLSTSTTRDDPAFTDVWSAGAPILTLCENARWPKASGKSNSVDGENFMVSD